MSGKAGKGAAGRGKSKGGKAVSRSKKAGLQFPVGRCDPASNATRLLAPENASNASKSPDRRLNRRPAGSAASSNCA